MASLSERMSAMMRRAMDPPDAVDSGEDRFRRQTERELDEMARIRYSYDLRHGSDTGRLLVPKIEELAYDEGDLVLVMVKHLRQDDVIPNLGVVKRITPGSVSGAAGTIVTNTYIVRFHGSQSGLELPAERVFKVIR